MQSTLSLSAGPALQNASASPQTMPPALRVRRAQGQAVRETAFLLCRSGAPGAHMRGVGQSGKPVAHPRGCKSSNGFVHQRCTSSCCCGDYLPLTGGFSRAHLGSTRSASNYSFGSNSASISVSNRISNSANYSTNNSISCRSSRRSITHCGRDGCLWGAKSRAEERHRHAVRCASGAQAQTASVLVEGEGSADVALGEESPGASADVAAGEHGTGAGKDEEELTRMQLLWRAAKPPLYSVALIPLLVGASAAYLEHGTFSPARFWSFLLHSVLVIAWLNLSNDAFDAETGVDKDKKESVVNITGSRTGVLVAAFACLALGVAGLLRGALAVGDLRIFQLLAAAIACGYVYQSPPFRLSYKGLGEPLCFIAFGPLATTAFYLYQASAPAAQAAVGPTALAASALVGATTALILFCSHFHQIESDLCVGKMSPLVRLGTARGASVVQGVVAVVYAATLGLCLTRTLPLVCLIPLSVTIPLALDTVRFVRSNHTDKTKIFMAKYFCNKLHIAFGLMLALGLALGRKFPFAF